MWHSNSDRERSPVVAGQFYPGTKKGLLAAIEECYGNKFGPGKISAKDIKAPQGGKRKLIGVVCPHAGYYYSGSAAAHSFRAVAADGLPQTFVIVGPNHSGEGESIALSGLDYCTPLGAIPNDDDLANKVSSLGIPVDDDAHAYEHSLEVQVPFISHMLNLASQSDDRNVRDAAIKVRMIAICMRNQSAAAVEKVASAVFKAASELGRDILIVASSDFSHVGFNYMTMPPAGKKLKDYIYEQDRKALEKIEKLDWKGLLEVIEKENITACGPGPVSVLLAFAGMKSKSAKATLLKYYSSYDISPGDSAVGYASVKVHED